MLVLSVALPAAFSQSNNAAAPSKPSGSASSLNSIDPLGIGEGTRRPLLTVGDSTGKPAEEKKDKDKAPRKGPTEITAREASFDQRTRQAVFLGKVEVKDPEFNITCDKLTAVLKAEKVGGKSGPDAPVPKATPAPPPPANGAPAPKKDKAGGLEKAIAEGSVVIVQEKTEGDGTVSRSVGKAKRAEFESTTGDMILIGWPSVQQGINTVVATEEGTVMTLNREGRMKAVGMTKTIIQDSGSAKQLSPP